jgi:surface antigen
MKKLTLLILLTILVSGCSTNRSQVGAVLGGGTMAASCAQFTTEPAALFVCTMGGAFAGANIMYNSDYDVHNAVFVDHLNNGPAGSSYTNWYNGKTGNSGIIKTTRSYLKGPIKCKDYDATIDITNQWPLIGLGGVNRKMVFGTACQLPDGRWVESPETSK